MIFLLCITPEPNCQAKHFLAYDEKVQRVRQSRLPHDEGRRKVGHVQPVYSILTIDCCIQLSCFVKITWIINLLRSDWFCTSWKTWLHLERPKYIDDVAVVKWRGHWIRVPFKCRWCITPLNKCHQWLYCKTWQVCHMTHQAPSFPPIGTRQHFYSKKLFCLYISVACKSKYTLVEGLSSSLHLVVHTYYFCTHKESWI